MIMSVEVPRFSRYNVSVGIIVVKIKVVSGAARRAVFFILALSLVLPAAAQSNFTLRVMAANTTSGNGQSYQDAGIRIFQGLKPDIVAVQEFRYNSSSSSNALRPLVDLAFGTNFQFFVEPTGNIPNGIISRYPIVAAGSWDDTQVSDRGFAWAQIDLPGTNDLYVVSVHLLTSGATVRNTQANNLKNLIQANFPANAWIIVAGDLNTDSRSEACVTTFKTFLSDTPIPSDAESGGNENTNAGRNKPYDYVLASPNLANLLTPAVVGTRTFPKGLVFDSRVYTPLTDVSPVQAGDSGVANMQHMAVLKDFSIPVGVPNTNPPSITTQPLNQTNSFGATAQFQVVATGATPLAYQWRHFGTNLSGATTATLTFTNLQTAQAGPYTVVITNAFGSITSAVATLTVDATPRLTSQPQSQFVTVGANATFAVTAVGGPPLFYQWQFNNAPLNAATNSTLIRSNTQPGDAGAYRVVVSNSAGSVTSSVAQLNVNSTTPELLTVWNFNSNPADASTTTGSTQPAVGSGTASLVGGATATFATGDTTFDPAGNTDNTAWNTATYPAQGAGNKTRGVQFQVSTVGRQNLVIAWSLRLSSTASKYSRLQYSTNGTDFLDFPTPVSLSADSLFERKTNDLSAFPGVNDNPDFSFRLVSEFESTALNNANANYVTAGTGTYGTGGTMRYDMVTISGTPLVSGTAPTVTNQPLSQVAQQGEEILFSVGAEGTAPLSYQWRFNGQQLPGATASQLLRVNVQPADAGLYSVVVSNSAGFTESEAAQLQLHIPAPQLVSPAPGVLTWTGLSNLTYSIQSSTNLNNPAWQNLGNRTSPTGQITFTNLPTGEPQRFFRVVYP